MMAKIPYLTKMPEEHQANLDSYFGEDRRTTDIIFQHSRAELAVFFRFLDELRASGTINMFDAAVPLAEAFDLTPEVARAIFSRWGSSFSEHLDVEDRVMRAEGWRSHEGFPDPRGGGEA
jgi:hypothetical protein